MKLFEIVVQENAKEFIEQVVKDCRPFLKAKRAGQLVFRGMKSFDEFIYNKPVRKNRTPLNTPAKLHDIIDQFFKKKFGYYFRSNAIFVTGDYNEAIGYGDAYAIYPIGDFQFLWSQEVDDLFIELKRLLQKDSLSIKYFKPNAKHNEESKKALDEYLNNKFIDAIKDLNYQNMHLVSAIESKNEIMIHCDAYHAIAVNNKIHNIINIDEEMYNLL